MTKLELHGGCSIAYLIGGLPGAGDKYMVQLEAICM